jgi:hypothetical protein
MFYVHIDNQKARFEREAAESKAKEAAEGVVPEVRT